MIPLTKNDSEQKEHGYHFGDVSQDYERTGSKKTSRESYGLEAEHFNKCRREDTPNAAGDSMNTQQPTQSA